LLVHDSLSTLQDLAKMHRSRLSIPVIGITGSNGKTTTKELIHQILSRKFKVHATPGNLNNHIGVPLTILGITDHEAAVVEMGANHPGEIDFLCRIAAPDYGLITNIGKAHLEGFGSIEGVRKTKAELYHYMAEKKGTAFVNSSDPLLQNIAASAGVRTVFYGKGENSICDGEVTLDDLFLSMSINFFPGGDHKVHTQLTGRYNAENILAAACIGKYFRVPPEDIVDAAERYSPKNSRSQYIETEGNKLIMDAYNANPNSMRNAIQNFLKLKAPAKMMILGDMLELGTYSRNEHLDILNLLKKESDIKVMLVGPEFKKTAEETDYMTFEDVNGLMNHFREHPVKDHLILLKGSRGMQLEKLRGLL